METAPNMASQKDATISFYDKNGHEYVKNQREFYSDIPDTGRIFFQETLLPDINNKTIADIGCGAGDDLVSYKKMGAARVIGVEPSEAMRLEAKKTIEKSQLDVELLGGQWAHIPLKDESLDVVTARFSFHVLQGFDEIYKEVARVLKKDGVFLIAVPHPDHDAKLAKEQNLKPGEKIKIPIFDGKVIVENQPHTMEEYLSKECCEYFTVEKNTPYSMYEDPDEREPSGLLLLLRRK